MATTGCRCLSLSDTMALVGGRRTTGCSSHHPSAAIGQRLCKGSHLLTFCLCLSSSSQMSIEAWNALQQDSQAVINRDARARRLWPLQTAVV